METMEVLEITEPAAIMQKKTKKSTTEDRKGPSFCRQRIRCCSNWTRGSILGEMLDEELRATGCISPTSQQGNRCLSLRPAVPRLTPRLAENQITTACRLRGKKKSSSKVICDPSSATCRDKEKCPCRDFTGDIHFNLTKSSGEFQKG